MFNICGMSWALVLALGLGIIGITAGNEYGYPGFIGCRFTKSLCLKDELCVNDGLFWNCQSRYNYVDHYKYDLDIHQLKNLEGEIEALLNDGYTWDSLLTQCVVANALLAFRRGEEYDPGFCLSGGSRGVDNMLEQDSDMLMKRYLSEYYGNAFEDEIPQNLIGPMHKKDEFVNVHKYLKAHKRDPDSGEFFLFGEDYYNEPPKQESSNDYDFSDYEDLLNSLTPRDLQLLRAYLTFLDYNYDSKVDNEKDYYYDQDYKNEDYSNNEYSNEDYKNEDYKTEGDDKDEEYYEVEETPEEFYDNEVETPSESEEESFEVDEGDKSWMETPAVEEVEPVETQDKPEVTEEQMGETVDEPEMTYEDNIVPDEEELMEEEEEGMTEAEEDPIFMSMTPEDANMLGELLQEKVSVQDLDDVTIERLNAYVDSMLDTLKEINHEKKENLKEKEEATLADYFLNAPDEVVVQEEGGPRYVITEEDMGNPVLNNLMDTGLKIDNMKRGPAKSPLDDADAPDQHDHGSIIGGHMRTVPNDGYRLVDAKYAYITVDPKEVSKYEATTELIPELESLLNLTRGSLTEVRVDKGSIYFLVNDDNNRGLNSSALATEALANSEQFYARTQHKIVDAGIGDGDEVVKISRNDGPRYFVVTFVLCGCIAGLVLAVITLFIVRRHSISKDKLAQITQQPTAGDEACKDYQDLCRQRMQSKTSDKPEPVHVAQRIGSNNSESAVRSPSSRSSTSSWSEEPVVSNMDISTGHIVLSYMEDHWKNKDRLEQEWDSLCAYEAEPNATVNGIDPANMRKNRYSDVLPYDHSRVVLSRETNVSGADYINANSITDHDPRNPAYIATQGPLPHTVADFWQMVWEQGCVVLVNLTKLTENGNAMCHRYWPEEGSDLYHIYEVHLVSEHIWCDDYLVRSFYLKNLQTNETRTVTQFHFLSWPDLGVPNSVKGLLDFRRKVNKSYKGRSCPVMVHCSDGSGRTGTYCLIDMVLNRLGKGAKEIDIAATLEHIRDQRVHMVKTKAQFEFALASVAEEVHAILKALPQ